MMTDDPKFEKRKLLCAELEHKIAKARRSARRNYFAGYTLKVTAIFSSILAGVLGLVNLASPEIIGVVALIPGGSALLAQELKLQSKANHFYKMSNMFKSIKSRADYSEDPADSTANLAQEASQLRLAMNSEFEQYLAFGWASHTPNKGSSA